jgi:hypothetical protein
LRSCFLEEVFWGCFNIEEKRLQLVHFSTVRKFPQAPRSFL